MNKSWSSVNLDRKDSHAGFILLCPISDFRFMTKQMFDHISGYMICIQNITTTESQRLVMLQRNRQNYLRYKCRNSVSGRLVDCLSTHSMNTNVCGWEAGRGLYPWFCICGSCREALWCCLLVDEMKQLRTLCIRGDTQYVCVQHSNTSDNRQYTGQHVQMGRNKKENNSNQNLSPFCTF